MVNRSNLVKLLFFDFIIFLLFILLNTSSPCFSWLSFNRMKKKSFCAEYERRDDEVLQQLITNWEVKFLPFYTFYVTKFRYDEKNKLLKKISWTHLKKPTTKKLICSNQKVFFLPIHFMFSSLFILKSQNWLIWME